MHQTSTGLIFLDLILYFLALILIGKRKRNFDFRIFWAYLSALLFCVYAAWGGDYFHYQEEFEDARAGFQVNLEPVYYYFVNIVQNSTQLRVIIWGSGLLCLFLSSRHIKIYDSLILFCFILSYLPRFSYARASLAMSVMMLGVVIFTKETRRRVLYTIIGGLIIFSSSFFHRSAIFGILMGSVSILLYRYVSKKMLFWMVVLAPIAIILIEYAFTEILFGGSDAAIVSASLKYLENEQAINGLGYIIETILMRASIYFSAFLFVLIVIRNHYDFLPKQIKVIGCYLLLTVIGSSVFALDLGLGNTAVIYNRTLLFAQLPSAFFNAYCLQSGVERKWLRVTLYTGGIAASYALIYSLYCSIVG